MSFGSKPKAPHRSHMLINILKCLNANRLLDEMTELLYVTGFAKTVPNRTAIEIPFITWHES